MPAESLALVDLTISYFKRLHDTPLRPKRVVIVTRDTTYAKMLLESVQVNKLSVDIEKLEVNESTLTDMLEWLVATTRGNMLIVFTPFSLEHLAYLTVLLALKGRFDLYKHVVSKPPLIHPLEKISVYEVHALYYERLPHITRPCTCKGFAIDEEILKLFSKSGEYAYSPLKLARQINELLEQ